MPIIEITGSSGTGKSRLIERMRPAAERAGITVLPPRARSKDARNSGLANILLELSLAPMAGAALVRRLPLWVHGTRAAARYADSPYYAARALRGLWRQLATRERLVRATPPDAIVIVDEFTVHAAQYLFAHSAREAVADDVERFLARVPLPDTLVCLTAPDELLIERMRTRHRPPRRHLDDAARARYIRHAQRVTRLVTGSRALAGRVIEVDVSRELDDEAVAALLERIAGSARA